MTQLELKGPVPLTALSLMAALSLLPLVEGGFDHDILYWVLLLLLGTALWVTVQNGSGLGNNINGTMVSYVLFAVWGGASIFWSLNPHRTLVEFLLLVCYGLVFLLVIRLDQINLVRVGRIALIAGTGIAILGIGEYLFTGSGRIQSTFTNPNPLGIYLVMLFFVAWGLFLRHSSRWLTAAAAALLVALFLTGSRGSFFALVIALPLLFMGLRGKNLWNGIAKTAVCLVIAVLLTQGVVKLAPHTRGFTIAERILTDVLVKQDTVPGSVEGRWAFWQVGGRLVLSEPLQGYGLGTHYLAYYLDYGGDRWYARFAHNHYLQVAVELGLVGLVLFVCFLLTGGRTVWQRLRKPPYPAYLPGIVAALVAFLLHIAIDFSWNFPGAGAIFFALAGAAIGGDGDRRFRLRFGYKPAALLLIFLVLLTSWKLSSGYVYAQGVKAAFHGDLEKSTRLYETANAFYPINSMGYSFASQNYLAMYRENGDSKLLDRALVLAQRAVSLSPADGLLNNRLGKLYWFVGEMDKAEYHLAKGAQFGAYLLERYLDLGKFYLHQQRLEDAERVFLAGLGFQDAALRALPDKDSVKEQIAELNLLLARIYDDKGEHELSQHHLKAAEAVSVK